MREDLNSIGRQMQIDRALDSQVAKLVFGLEVSLVEEGWGGVYGLCTSDNEPLLNYSGDIKLAWTIFEEIKRRTLFSANERLRFDILVNYPYALNYLTSKEAAQRICQSAVDALKERKQA